MLDRLRCRIQRCPRLQLRDPHERGIKLVRHSDGRVSRLAVCLTRTFLTFFESAQARALLFERFLTSNHVDPVGFSDASQVKLRISIKSIMDFLHEVQNRFVRSIKLLKILICRGLFHLPNDVEHFRDWKLVPEKLSQSDCWKYCHSCDSDSVERLSLSFLS